MMEPAGNSIKCLPHHEQKNLCTTRPPYRQGRKLTAVKVYTVNDESVHLLIHGVPSIGLLSEVSMLCERYGRVKSVKLVDQYSPEQEEFTNVYHVQYERIQSARFAKKIIDTKSFFGGVLHVCYAPELETIQETKLKLVNRKREIAKRTRNLAFSETDTSHNHPTSKIDNDTFQSGYAEKLLLGSCEPSNSSAALHPCLPSTSTNVWLESKAPPIIGPEIPVNTQLIKPNIHPDSASQQFSLSDPSTKHQNSKHPTKNTPLTMARKVFSSRKRPGPSYDPDSLQDPTHKHGNFALKSPSNDYLKKDYIPKKMKKIDPTSLKHRNPGICDSGPHLLTHQKPSTAQAFQSSTSVSHPLEQDISKTNAVKRPAVGPVKFLPRSVMMKKPKK